MFRATIQIMDSMVMNSGHETAHQPPGASAAETLSDAKTKRKNGRLSTTLRPRQIKRTCNVFVLLFENICLL